MGENSLANLSKIILDNISQPVAYKDMSGRYIYVNERFCDYLNKDKKEIINKTDYDLYNYDKAEKYRFNDLRAFYESEKNNIKKIQTIKQVKLSDRFIKKRYISPYIKNYIEPNDGFVEITKVPLKRNGIHVGIQVILNDITEDIVGKNQLGKIAKNIEKELKSASYVCKSLFPIKPTIENDHFSFSWRYKPNDYVNGEILNTFLIDEDHWGFYHLDSSGSNIGAALISSFLSKTMTVSDKNHEILLNPNKTANTLCKEFPVDISSNITCLFFYGVLNIKNGEFKWVKCATKSPVLIRNSSYKIIPGISNSFIFLNDIFEDLEFDMVITQLEKGDQLYFASNGILENQKSGINFGNEKLAETALDFKDKPPQERLEKIIEAAQNWSDNISIPNDSSIFVIEKK